MNSLQNSCFKVQCSLHYHQTPIALAQQRNALTLRKQLGVSKASVSKTGSVIDRRNAPWIRSWQKTAPTKTRHVSKPLSLGGAPVSTNEVIECRDGSAQEKGIDKGLQHETAVCPKFEGRATIEAFLGKQKYTSSNSNGIQTWYL